MSDAQEQCDSKLKSPPRITRVTCRAVYQSVVSFWGIPMLQQQRTFVLILFLVIITCLSLWGQTEEMEGSGWRIEPEKINIRWEMIVPCNCWTTPRRN